MSEFGWEKVVEPGNYTLSFSDAHNHTFTLFIFTTPSFFSPINPAAESLDDYRNDYPTTPVAVASHQVLVHGVPTNVDTQNAVRVFSTEDLIINDIPMLRQRYSMGFFDTDQDGNRFFNEQDEMGLDNALRYVFFDGKTFVVLTGWQADNWIDSVARSIRLAK